MHQTDREPGGELLFLLMGAAVYLTVAVICAAAFLPAAAGVVVGLSTVVLVAAGLASFFGRFLGSGH